MFAEGYQKAPMFRAIAHLFGEEGAEAAYELCTLIETERNRGHQEGYDLGRDVGHAEGYNEGYLAGMEYDEGFVSDVEDRDWCLEEDAEDANEPMCTCGCGLTAEKAAVIDGYKDIDPPSYDENGFYYWPGSFSDED